MPNVHRIKSFRLSNPLSIDLLFAQDCIFSKLIRLESLNLNDIHPEDIINLLDCLVSLPCLSSLVIAYNVNKLDR